MSTMVEKSAAEAPRGDELEGMSDGNGSSFRTTETLLRLLPIAPCVAALLVMLHDSQNNEFGSVSYSHIGAFRFLVHANGICAGYSLLSAIISAKSRLTPTKSLAWTFFVIDQLLTYIILGAGAVATEVLYLAYKGDSTITWSPACGSYGGFCHRATTSVVITFLVVASFAIISLISSYKLFSKFDAPIINPIKGIQSATFG